MKRLSCFAVTATLLLVVNLRAYADTCEDGMCNYCLLVYCGTGKCTGASSCQFTVGFCSPVGTCVTNPDGTRTCPGANASRQCTVTELNPVILRNYPWIKSAAFVDAVAIESTIPELRPLLTELQSEIAETGVAEYREIQTATMIGDPPTPAQIKAGDVHASRLAGLAVTMKDGAYLFQLYVDTAHDNGETKYKSIRAMIDDKVQPMETISVSGHSYTRSVGAESSEGRF